MKADPQRLAETLRKCADGTLLYSISAGHARTVSAGLLRHAADVADRVIPTEGPEFDAAVERGLREYELYRTGCSPHFDEFARTSIRMIVRAALKGDRDE